MTLDMRVAFAASSPTQVAVSASVRMTLDTRLKS
jgi:hypothetical protein